MTLQQKIDKAKILILSAECALGPLTRGQRSDLLLDNIEAIQDSAEAHTLVDQIAAVIPYRSRKVAL